jgi:hypothetical protein
MRISSEHVGGKRIDVDDRIGAKLVTQSGDNRRRHDDVAQGAICPDEDRFCHATP